MIVNNRSLALAGTAATKDNKEMQNIAIRASPQRSASSVTGNGKLRSEAARNVVTVNGCQGATKNSSIIYLSPAQDTNLPPSPSPGKCCTHCTGYLYCSMFSKGIFFFKPIIKLWRQIWLEV